MTRRRLGFALWRLRESPTPTRYRAHCLICAAHSSDAVSAGAAQQWCLEHAGRTHHSAYEVAWIGRFDAAMEDNTTDIIGTADTADTADTVHSRSARQS
ncbi:hypothetical protein ACIRF8_10030 [Streptomyces sp. NPDC102406]|uniref:DUF7848 domain-containing protein n=1 Tax=Streptomyces sp. NPDC102406 TaxID=3366171 RepID=UPI003813750A